MKPKYQNLIDVLRGIAPRVEVVRYMEIGTYDGVHAREIIDNVTKEMRRPVEYYGFDLFEDMTRHHFKTEIGKRRRPPSMEVVRRLLEGTEAMINLYKGDTKNTLHEFVKWADELGVKMDFVFIDGGHSFETVDNDWKYVQRLMHGTTKVVFDDYFSSDVSRDLRGGCNRVIDSLDQDIYKKTFLPNPDHVPTRVKVVTSVLVELKDAKI